MNTALVAVLIPGAILGGVILLMLLCACCVGAAAGAKTDCDRPPDRTKDPLAYSRWQRECERKQKATGAPGGEGVQLLRVL